MMSRTLDASPDLRSPRTAELGKLYEKRVLIDDLIRNLERYAQIGPERIPGSRKDAAKIINS